MRVNHAAHKRYGLLMKISVPDVGELPKFIGQGGPRTKQTKGLLLLLLVDQ